MRRAQICHLSRRARLFLLAVNDIGMNRRGCVRAVRGAIGLARPLLIPSVNGMTSIHPRRRPMDRMEHIRGKILEGDQTVLDPVDGYLACHDHKGRKTLYGYFEMPTEELKVLNRETCYRLVLSDGRQANIYTEIVPSNIAGKSVAEFHINGLLKK
jgi:hypothetical protein